MPSPDCDAQSLHCKAARLLKEIITECIGKKIFRVTNAVVPDEISFNELVSKKEEAKEDMRNLLRETGLGDNEPFQLPDDKKVKEFWSNFHTYNPEKARDFLDKELINKPFQKFSDSSKKLEATRFSDGRKLRYVFYGSLEIDTAQAEAKNAFLKRHKMASTSEENSFPFLYQCFTCCFIGKAKDLRNNQGEYPELVDENYCFCQKIGAIAGSKLDGLVVPSARKEDGSCLPVFNKCALSDPKYLGQIELTFDPGNEKVNIEEVPSDENN